MKILEEICKVLGKMTKFALVSQTVQNDARKLLVHLSKLNE